MKNTQPHTISAEKAERINAEWENMGRMSKEQLKAICHQYSRVIDLTGCTKADLVATAMACKFTEKDLEAACYGNIQK